MDESFWTKKQSCKFSKVDIKKWRPFFDFVCFNGCHILKLRYLRRDSVEFQILLFPLLPLTYIFIIYHALLCTNSQGYDHVCGDLCVTTNDNMYHIICGQTKLIEEKGILL